MKQDRDSKISNLIISLAMIKFSRRKVEGEREDAETESVGS